MYIFSRQRCRKRSNSIECGRDEACTEHMAEMHGREAAALVAAMLRHAAQQAGIIPQTPCCPPQPGDFCIKPFFLQCIHENKFDCKSPCTLNPYIPPPRLYNPNRNMFPGRSSRAAAVPMQKCQPPYRPRPRPSSWLKCGGGSRSCLCSP